MAQRENPKADARQRSARTQATELPPVRFLIGGLKPRRRSIDGIRFRVRTGIPWQDVPIEYGPWNRVYDLFRR